MLIQDRQNQPQFERHMVKTANALLEFIFHWNETIVLLRFVVMWEAEKEEIQKAREKLVRNWKMRQREAALGFAPEISAS
ncbi:hypothetical protein OWV82_006603 [Melia azedarach]|uniref:Uncharacterized protein n=1 Tax=Melia azedarach TaxID=155640 RepID=A0ACC1YIG2_MELAZ|nr:hypothetical protein OWV82_006603 [Melia azedarach]